MARQKQLASLIFRTSLVLLLIICTTISRSVSAPTPNHDDRKLLVILLDGFRWDYYKKFGKNELSGFNRLACEGVKVEEIIPVFPSLSFVNYYSLMTGLYAESHGMVDNYMYDDRHDKQFLIGENADEVYPFWWDDGEPLWITAKKQGKSSYFWYWCGCEIVIRDESPDFCQPYLSSPNPSFQNFTDALNAAVEVLRNGSADIAGVYLEAIDDTGHHVGPNGVPMLDFIRHVDSELDRIQTVLETKRFPGQTSGNMFDRMNMAVFSDHGMTERHGGANDNRTGVIRIFDYVESTDYLRAMGSTVGPILSIWPLVGKEEWLYNRLVNAHDNLTVYRKQDIPEKYHIKNHYRIPYLYLVADFGYVIIRDRSTVVSNIGYHGYDPILRDMHGIFYARGQDFKNGFELPSLPNVDLYAMFCGLLDIEPSANNGTLYPVCELLADPTACDNDPKTGNDKNGNDNEIRRDKDNVYGAAHLNHNHKHVGSYEKILEMLAESENPSMLEKQWPAKAEQSDEKEQYGANGRLTNTYRNLLALLNSYETSNK